MNESIVCTKCFKYFPNTNKSNIHSSCRCGQPIETNIHCPSCGGEAFECDDAMAPIIAKLNKKGYITQYSCAGHAAENSKYTQPYISFIDLKNVPDEKYIPKKWYKNVYTLTRDYTSWRHFFDFGANLANIACADINSRSIIPKMNSKDRSKLIYKYERDKYLELYAKMAEDLPENPKVETKINTIERYNIIGSRIFNELWDIIVGIIDEVDNNKFAAKFAAADYKLPLTGEAISIESDKKETLYLNYSLNIKCKYVEDNWQNIDKISKSGHHIITINIFDESYSAEFGRKIKLKFDTSDEIPPTRIESINRCRICDNSIALNCYTATTFILSTTNEFCSFNPVLLDHSCNYISSVLLIQYY